MRHERAVVVDPRTHVAVGQLEPGARKRVREILGIGTEFLTNLIVDGVNLHRHVGIGHDRIPTHRRIGGIDRLFVFTAYRPVPTARHQRGILPTSIHSRRGNRNTPCPIVSDAGGPGAFDTGGKRRLARLAIQGPGFVPPETLSVNQVASLRARHRVACDSHHRPCALPTVCPPAGQCRGFLVVHRHALERLAHMQRCSCGIGFTVHAFGIHIDEAHVNCGERIVHRCRFIKVAAGVPRTGPATLPRHPSSHLPREPRRLRGQSRNQRS